MVVEQEEQAHDEAVEEQEAGGDEGEGRESGRECLYLLLQLLSSSYRQERLHAALHCTQLTAEDIRRKTHLRLRERDIQGERERARDRARMRQQNRRKNKEIKQ